MRHAEHRIFHHVAVVRDIVTGKHGKRRQAALAAAIERFDQDPRGGVRFRRIFEVVKDPGVLQIQLTGGGIDAVAFLRDGERYDRHLRFAKLLNYGGQRVQLCIQAFMYGANNNRLMSFSPFLQHGEQMILRAQLAHQHVAAEQAYFTDPPVAAFFIQHPVC